jgi:hypothetical protein
LCERWGDVDPAAAGAEEAEAKAEAEEGKAEAEERRRICSCTRLRGRVMRRRWREVELTKGSGWGLCWALVSGTGRSRMRVRWHSEERRESTDPSLSCAVPCG